MSFDIEPRQLIYNRTGNLSQVTTINAELAEQFMRISDLRLDVVITDSDKKPEQEAVAVGSDVLAWRSIVPIGELTKSVLRPKRYHQTEIVDTQYRVQIHDQIIDDDIRKKKPASVKDYEKMYLARLRGEVKDALAETLRGEKLGLRAQYLNWPPYVGAGFVLPSLILEGDHEGIALLVASTVFVVHPLIAILSNIHAKNYDQINKITSQFAPGLRIPVPPHINPRDWKHALMPIVPVDKWFKGRRFLAQHGNDLIVARS